jgi:hypothetical protein
MSQLGSIGESSSETNVDFQKYLDECTFPDFPDYGDWTKSELAPEDPNYHIDAVRRVIIHGEYTTMQVKMELKAVNSTLRFMERRSMRENYPADDLARQISEGSLSNKCGVLCECLEVKASKASLASLVCCPILTCGYICAFCDAKAAHKQNAKKKAQDKESQQKNKLSTLTTKVEKLQVAMTSSTTSGSEGLQAALLA